ncbi:MAG: hypothetical protein ACPG19_03950 [Saprospiraceae bacterium]
MTRKSILYLKHFTLLFVFSSIFTACDSEEPTPTYTPPDSSFGLVYTKIFQQSCALSNCHDGTTSPNLTGETTYNAIVNADVKNVQAIAAGLQLIRPNDVDSSFLYQKLIYDTSNFKFGSKMPVGGLVVSDDAILFVKEWIEAGAPLTGHVADRTLIE